MVKNRAHRRIRSHQATPRDGRAAVVKSALNEALKESKSFTIRFDGASGTLSFKVNHALVARYLDIYEAIDDLMPELMEKME